MDVKLQSGLYPQEEMLEVQNRKNILSISLLKETDENEKRVGLTPVGVTELVKQGYRVFVEQSAGSQAFFSDLQYSESGAEIKQTKDELFSSDILIKIGSFSNEEIEKMRPGQTLFSTVNIARYDDNSFFKKLCEKRVRAFGFEFFREVSGAYPYMQSISEIVGSSTLFIATQHLMRKKGILLGAYAGIAPTQVVILGAGTVAEYAVRAFNGIGASIKIFGESVEKLRRLRYNLNMSLYTSVIDRAELARALEQADIVIGCIHTKIGRTPIVITEEMVMKMKPQSLIIDVCIDQGGCVETSQIRPLQQAEFEKHGVTHHCVPNITSMIPQTASQAFSNHLTNMLGYIGEQGDLIRALRGNECLRSGMYVYNGSITNRTVAKHLGMPLKDLNILIGSILDY